MQEGKGQPTMAASMALGLMDAWDERGMREGLGIAAAAHWQNIPGRKNWQEGKWKGAGATCRRGCQRSLAASGSCG